MAIDVMSIIAPKIEAYKTTLINIAKSRFLVAAQEYGMNDKESAALTAIADSIDVTVVVNENSVIFEITYESNHYLDVITTGMSAPLTGGDGGIAMNPDGSTYQSEVDPKLWGNPIESFAKEGKDVMQEVETVAASLGKDIIDDAFADSNEEIAKAFSAELKPKLQEEIGGIK